jgi:hypothetical protein
MKNKIIILAAILLFTDCTGPGGGPLQKNAKPSRNLIEDIGGQSHSEQVETKKINIIIDPCKNCITIAGLIENKKSYSGKIVTIKGVVTKINPEIMGRNWVHIQDGTGYNGAFDLTLTTQIMVQIGDTVTFEGRIELDRDFGYGYVYNVLMEDSKAFQ